MSATKGKGGVLAAIDPKRPPLTANGGLRTAIGIAINVVRTAAY
jgi:hypothetical protein